MENKQNKKQLRISPNLAAALGAIVLMLGGFFLSYSYIQTKKVQAYDLMASYIYKEDSEGSRLEIEDKKEEKEETKTDTSVLSEETEKYIGYLSIPKIKFKKGFFKQESSQNDVEKNIFIVKGSTYPDVENGNFIVAAHSGTGWKAFFNDLYKLEKGDTVTVTYNDKEYNYDIKKIYQQPKTGKIAIYRDFSKTTLTLITCTNNDSTTQTVYIAELKKD